jgi:hypothetical protein
LYHVILLLESADDHLRLGLHLVHLGLKYLQQRPVHAVQLLKPLNVDALFRHQLATDFGLELLLVRDPIDLNFLKVSVPQRFLFPFFFLQLA